MWWQKAIVNMVKLAYFPLSIRKKLACFLGSEYNCEEQTRLCLNLQARNMWLKIVRILEKALEILERT